MNNKRLKVLLGCYACDPNFGSEPGMGWQFVRLIAKSHDVHAIVEKGEFEQNLTDYAKAHPEEIKGITFHFIPREHHHFLRKIWPPSYYWFYNKWQKKAYQYAIKLHEKELFDLVHQVNMAGYRSPGELWKLDLPFIWGPIGGLNHTAWNLLPFMGIYGIVFYTMRNLINAFQKRWGRAVIKAAAKAHSILVSDPNDCAEIKKLWNKESLVMREVGTTASTTQNDICKHRADTPLQICWAGVHEPSKGLNILLEAISHCKKTVHVHVLGHGPCSTKWQKLARKLKVESLVTFHGKLPHYEVFNVMATSHVFCITSISEGGTTSIIMEALQHGLPVVALDHCAFASVIDETCGIKISIRNRKSIAQHFADALDLLAGSEETRQRLAQGAIERAKDFNWDSKLDLLNEVYYQACEERNP